MKFFQAFSMALKSILQNKMRSFLTMLGIIIGVGSVTALVSVMQGTQRQVIEEYKKMGANTISVKLLRGAGHFPGSARVLPIGTQTDRRSDPQHQSEPEMPV